MLGRRSLPPKHRIGSETQRENDRNGAARASHQPEKSEEKGDARASRPAHGSDTSAARASSLERETDRGAARASQPAGVAIWQERRPSIVTSRDGNLTGAPPEHRRQPGGGNLTGAPPEHHRRRANRKEAPPEHRHGRRILPRECAARPVNGWIDHHRYIDHHGTSVHRSSGDGGGDGGKGGEDGGDCGRVVVGGACACGSGSGGGLSDDASDDGPAAAAAGRVGWGGALRGGDGVWVGRCAGT
eukprot:gene18010-biopygen3852